MRDPIEEVKTTLDSWKGVTNDLSKSLSTNMELETTVFKDSFDFFMDIQKSLITWCRNEINKEKKEWSMK